MKRKLLCLAAFAVVAPVAAMAQTSGQLTGRVTDSDGKPVVGATIKLLGTKQGGYSKAPDGRYLIAGIRAGQYDVEVSAVGLQKDTSSIRISIDQTTTHNVQLTTSSVRSKTVVVTGTRVEPIKRDRAATVRSATADDINNSARTSIQSAVEIEAGVTTSGVNGFSIRGGRATETSIRIDGVKVSDPFQGGFGSTSAGLYPTVSTLAVSEVQVVPSGFSAEYGDVFAGVVNSVTRTGRNDRYEGQLRFRTPVQALYGSSDPLTVKITGTNRDTTLAAAKSQASGRQLYEFGFGGPIPFTDAVTFYITGKYEPIDNTGSGLEVYDMTPEYAAARAQVAQRLWGFSLEPTNLGDLPGQSAMVRDLNGKFKVNIGDGMYLELGGEIGLTSRERGAWSNYYMMDRNAQGVLERDAQNWDENTVINRFMARYFQSLDESSYFEVTGSYVRNYYEAGKKDETKKYGIFDIYDLSATDVDADGDGVIDNYSEGATQDVYLNQYNPETFIVPTKNAKTGFYEGDQVGGASMNPYGITDPNFFPTHGNERVLEKRESQTFNLRGAYETNFDLGEVKTQIKAGADFSSYVLRRHENNLPWFQGGFFDVYGYSGYNYFEDDSIGTVKNFFSDPHTPYEGALYVQTKFDYKSIVFQPGVRFDFFNPNTKLAPVDRTSNLQIIDQLRNGADASMKFQVSPRIGVSYPITDASQFRVNFAMMFKRPELNYLYDNAYGNALRASQIFGNPDADPQKVFVYELGYTARLAENYFLDVTAYYRDIYNQTGITLVPAQPNPYSIYTVNDYGNVRGLEISARRELSDNFKAEINYSLMKAVGTASGPLSNYYAVVTASPDPLTGTKTFPLVEYPLTYDQTHTLNGSLSLVWGEDEGPSIGGLKLLENGVITVTATYLTGLPYTRETQRGQQISEFNSQRLPSQFNTEAHLERNFKLRDWFGESVGNLELGIFADIYNILNLTNPVAVRFSRNANVPEAGRYSVTGSADYDGTNMAKEIGEFSNTPYYRDIDPTRPETFDNQQYDNFGRRLYNPYADSNLDGVETQQEKYEGYQRWVTTVQALRGTYQTPRSVFVGFKVRF